MKSHLANIRPKADATTKEIQEYLNAIYGSKNSHMSDDYIYSFIAEKSGILARAVTKAHRLGEKYEPNPVAIIRPLSWLFALATNHRIDLGLAFITKFPGVCPHCMEPVCDCHNTLQKPKRFKYNYEVRDELNAQVNKFLNSPSKRITFEKCLDIINTVYPGNASDWRTRPEIHFSKLLEELGELREAIRKRELGQVSAVAVEEELADIFAWLIGAWKLIYSPRNPELTVEFLNYFHDGCPICGEFPCDCKKGSDRFYTLISADEWIRLKKLLEELKETLGSSPGSFIADDLLKSLATAQADPRGVLVKTFFRGLIDAMQKTNSSTSVPDESRSLASRILASVEVLESQNLVVRRPSGGSD